ncbi:protein kinase domain-containing protein [Baekduia sp. Peel2402]|uniref:protein kinase domain-containing protein n=1 Tax=Baekduia sp. Peel2402 TaxID=3458296 RepID=UPI00403E7B8B
METAEHPTTSATNGSSEVVLDRYRLVRRLGGGGFGVVWLAHDQKLDRTVAVKRIPVPDAEARKRAQREGTAAARLQHAAIVALHETGTDEDHVYLVSEYVRGGTYARLLEIGALSDRDVVEIGVALCDALTHAHKRGVVHRDVKPLNVLIPDGGDGPPAKLTDFGVARIAGDDALTRTGDVVGTLAYMAPEQAEGGEVGEEADLYALGLCLYEGLSGVNPVRARGAGATARRVGQRLPPLGRLRRDLPLDLCEAIDAAVWPHADERGTVGELRASLCAALDDVGDEPGTIAGGPIEALAPVAPPRRYGLLARAAAAAGAAVLAGAALRWGLDGGGGAAAPIPPVAPLTGALAVALAALLLPRLAWMAACGAIVGWLASEGGLGADRAWLLAAAALPIPLLLRRATPVTWSLPALAPVMGLVAVSGGFPALAARAGRIEHRALTGALGAWWLLLGEAAFGEKLVLGPPNDSGFDAISAVVTSPAIVLVGVWAAAAAVLPFLVRGRLLVLDVLAASVWAAACAAGTQAALGATPRGLVEGAVLAGALALAPLARHLRSAERVDLP